MDLYVFGAGASTGYDVPIMRELLPQAFLPWFITPREPCHFEDKLVTVAEAIDQVYGASLAEAKSGEYPSTESAIKLQDANVEHLFAIARENGDTELEMALETVVFNTLDDRHQVRYDRPDGEYERLVRRLIESPRRASLVSFNYDVLLDRALARICQEHNIPWSYCVRFDAGIVNFPSYRQLSTNIPKIKLLKLHGSFNWRHCGQCGALRLYYFLSYALRPTWPQCERCSGNSFKPLLVAPAPEKKVLESLEPAWQTAAACLANAETLTIVGYSFPEIDQKSRGLFSQRLNKCRVITLVDRDAPTRQRIRDLLSYDSGSEIREFNSFQDYSSMASVHI